MATKGAYTQATYTGKYDKTTGLIGKYDNVREFWEDPLTGIMLRPALSELVERKNKRLERVRIIDLGCGSGDGYDTVMNVTAKDPGIFEYITQAITPNMLKEYVGVDLNDDLLRQAEEYFAINPKARFVKADLSNGFPKPLKEEEPFDIYLTTYGTLSHFHEEETVALLADVCRHAPANALFIGDWLGRYSYEWQDLWNPHTNREHYIDYRISYIYPEEERELMDVETFPLRLLSRDEVERIVQKASKDAGVEIRARAVFDRSILVGRHIDTGDYNKNCPRLRRAVNSLFEGYQRTNLETLYIDYLPKRGFDHLNNFFEMFCMSWNALVKYTYSLLSEYDAELEKFSVLPEVLPFYPEPLKETMYNMRNLIEGVGWLKSGDVRANVIEPQLGFYLRHLEMKLSPGLGVGHGMVGIFEIVK